MVQGRLQGGVVGGVVGNCARTRFLVRILHFLNLVEKKKYHKSLSGNYQDLWETFLYAFCHLCIPGFCPGLETDARVRKRV